MKRTLLGGAFCLLLFPHNAMAVCTSYPYPLTNGTTADANQVMSNFTCAALTSGATMDSVTLTGLTIAHGNFSAATSVAMQIESTNTNGYSGGLQFKISTVAATYAAGLIEAENTGQPGTLDGGRMFFWTAAEDGTHDLQRRMVIDGQGNVGIGTIAPTYPLYVNGTAYATGAAGALSDARHKHSVVSLPKGALADIMRLRPVTFFWNDPRDDGMKGKQVGFIAQEVEPVFPSIVLTQRNAEKTKGLKYDEFIPVLTKAIQEQQAEIQELRAANDNKSTEVSDLRGQISDLRRTVNMRTAEK